MTVGVRFTDGTTTITVSNGTTGWVLEYTPGSESASKETATDKCRVMLLSSLSTVRATIVSLNTLFRRAAARQTLGLGARVYVERDLGDGVWWRSEIVEALPVMDKTTVDLGLATGKPEFSLTFTRKNFWEGDRAQIAITNTNGTNNTSGLRIYSIDDSQSGKDNFVTLDSSDVVGDLPAPAEIVITDDYSSTYDIETIFMGLNWRSQSGGTFAQHIYEGENASGVSALPGTADYTLYSNGKYGSVSVLGSLDTVVYWTITSAELTRLAGNYFRVMGRFTITDADVQIRARVSRGTSHNLYISPYKWMTTDYFQEVGIVRLPPYLFGSNALTDLRLNIDLHNTGGTYTEGIDYVHLFPLDGWRQLEPVAGYVSQNEIITDNQWDDLLYVTNSSQIYSRHIAYGGKIMLEPGVAQRIYIVPTGGANAISTVKYCSIKLYYRPRRLTI